VGSDHSGYCCSLHLHLGVRCNGRACAWRETPGNGRREPAKGVSRPHLRDRHRDPHTAEMRLWRFDCSMWVGEGHRGRQCCRTGLARNPRAAAAVGAERAAVAAERSCEEDKKA
jgi:hypothetical protein